MRMNLSLYTALTCTMYCNVESTSSAAYSTISSAFGTTNGEPHPLQGDAPTFAVSIAHGLSNTQRRLILNNAFHDLGTSLLGDLRGVFGVDSPQQSFS